MQGVCKKPKPKGWKIDKGEEEVKSHNVFRYFYWTE
jgi:hypothetical protein